MFHCTIFESLNSRTRPAQKGPARWLRILLTQPMRGRSPTQIRRRISGGERRCRIYLTPPTRPDVWVSAPQHLSTGAWPGKARLLSVWASGKSIIGLPISTSGSRAVWTQTKGLGFSWRDTHPSGAASIEWFDRWIQTGDTAVKQRILDYNEDDCVATRVLLDGVRGLAFEGT